MEGKNGQLPWFGTTEFCQAVLDPGNSVKVSCIRNLMGAKSNFLSLSITDL